MSFNSIKKSVLVFGLLLAPTSVFAQTADSGTTDIRGTSLNLGTYRGKIVEKDGLFRLDAALNQFSNGGEGKSLGFNLRKRFYWGSQDSRTSEGGMFPITLQASGAVDINSTAGDRHSLEAGALSFAYIRGSVHDRSSSYYSSDMAPLNDTPAILEGQFVTPQLFMKKNEVLGLDENGLLINYVHGGFKGVIGVGNAPSDEDRKNGKLTQIELGVNVDPAIHYVTGPSAGSVVSRLSVDAGLRIANVANLKNVVAFALPWNGASAAADLGEFVYELRAEQIANTPIGLFFQHSNQWTSGDRHQSVNRIGASATF